MSVKAGAAHGDDDKLRRVLRAEEGRIAGLPHEEASVFALDGTPILEGVTQRRRGDVYFSPEHQLRLRDAVVTHNHPSAQSFSYADVALAVEHDVAEIRAVGVGRNGRRYTYRLQRPANGWPPEPLVWQAVLQARQTVSIEMGRMVLAGTVTRSEALFAVLHEIWTRVGDQLLCPYRRIIR